MDLAMYWLQLDDSRVNMWLVSRMQRGGRKVGRT